MVAVFVFGCNLAIRSIISSLRNMEITLIVNTPPETVHIKIMEVHTVHPRFIHNYQDSDMVLWKLTINTVK